QAYRNQQIVLSNCVAISENERTNVHLVAIRGVLNMLLDLAKDLDTCIRALENDNTVQGQMLHAMQESLRPVENPASSNIYSQVGNQMDVDHK
ncbi:hypothetical protein HDU98_001809, partial [Podochytrium sp. JEL0797]